jgi:60 kDa SS-A/Ro ribonucleoprotein
MRRFLAVGADGGTYYAPPLELSKWNARVVVRTAHLELPALIDGIAQASERAPRRGPALFALAIAAAEADPDRREYVLRHLPMVARTGSDLFQFVDYARRFRSWGRALRTAVGNWYLDKPLDDLAYQMVKYRHWEGWTHRDLLRLAHPRGAEPERAALFDWACGREVRGELPGVAEAYQRVQRLGGGGGSKAVRQMVGILEDHTGMPWEALPDWALESASVWGVLLEQGIPQTALMRQLPALTKLGLARGRSGRAIAQQLADPGRLSAARVHPISALAAMKTYASGRGARGESTWRPSRLVVDALDQAFYAAFGAVEPTGRRLCFALDVSESMTAPVAGFPLSAREASVAMALVTAATEEDSEIVAFTRGRAGPAWSPAWPGRIVTGPGFALSRLAVSPRQRLEDVIRQIRQLPRGATDCALPMLWAAAEGLEFDAFVIYTDNQTWIGPVHPYEALQRYREKMGIAAKLVVVALTPHAGGIADPTDPGTLDVAGFDAAVPTVISDFIRGDI